jgi:outer membrane lipoprotein-sorting protein
MGVALALAFAALATAEARAQELSLEEATKCLERNAPKKTLSFRAEFVKVDRVGGERKSRATVLGKKLADGLRRVVLRFEKPTDVRGTAMLMIEAKDGPSDFYVWSPDDRRVRRVASRGSGGLFGTDFSYDDFENWRAFQRTGKAERLPNATVAERAVYVVSTVPASQEASAYEKIVTSVDRETCVVLQVDSFEPGGRLRKVLRADPTKVQQVGELYIAGALELEDVIDQTHTKVKVDDVKIDVDIPDGRFRPADLSSGE